MSPNATLAVELRLEETTADDGARRVTAAVLLIVKRPGEPDITGTVATYASEDDARRHAERLARALRRENLDA